MHRARGGDGRGGGGRGWRTGDDEVSIAIASARGGGRELGALPSVPRDGRVLARVSHTPAASARRIDNHSRHSAVSARPSDAMLDTVQQSLSLSSRLRLYFCVSRCLRGRCPLSRRLSRRGRWRTFSCYWIHIRAGCGADRRARGRGVCRASRGRALAGVQRPAKEHELYSWLRLSARRRWQ